MRRISRDVRALISAISFVSVLTVAWTAGTQTASAQDDDHPHMGLGIGLGIGIGSALIQGMASHPNSATPPDQSAPKRKKAAATDSGDSGKKSKSPPAQPSQSSSGTTGVPPQGERRYQPGEIITSFAAGTSPQAINQIAQRYNLTQLETQNFPLIGTALYRWRLDGRRLLPDVIGALEQERVVASAQPNYIFTLQDDANAGSGLTAGDPAQYVLAKMLVQEAHKLATGKNVQIAIIDSEIDQTNRELAGSIAKTFDALGGSDSAHPHGTAMAGAIASHGRLLGIAPDAQLYVARAFDGSDAAKGTSFAVYKSLEWSADNDARLINMSFAGPNDPAMHRFLDAAYRKDIILVSAAGNAGPNSAPLYPGSDADVIAVTATDGNDTVFKMANRGDYIALSAPGVDIMVAAPGGSYKFTSGTSIAAAHVSGTVALLLEKNPALKPKDVRNILANSATPLGPKDRQSEIGAGLCNASQAVKALEDVNANPDGSAGVAKR